MTVSRVHAGNFDSARAVPSNLGGDDAIHEALVVAAEVCESRGAGAQDRAMTVRRVHAGNLKAHGRCPRTWLSQQRFARVEAQGRKIAGSSKCSRMKAMIASMVFRALMYCSTDGSPMAFESMPSTSTKTPTARAAQ